MTSRVFLVGLAIITTVVEGCNAPPESESSWIALGGPYARDVAGVMADPSRSGIVYAALTTGEIFRSENSGTVWTPLASLGSGIHPYRFVVSIDTPILIYSLTDAGIYLASSNKHRWERIALPGVPQSSGIHALAIDPWKSSTRYIGSDGHGVFRSTDAGLTWNSPNVSSPDLTRSTVVDLVIDPSRPNDLLAAVNGLGLLLSNDEGEHWTRLTDEFSATGSQIIRVFRRENTVVYATTSGSISRSVDGGHAWSPTRIAREGGTIFSFEQSPWNPNCIAAGTAEGPILSTDFGLTWTDVAGSLPHVPCSVAFRSDERTSGYFVYGESIGLQRTSDGGGHWESADNALGGSTIRLLASSDDGNLVYAALTRSVLTFDPGTAKWNPAGIGLEGDRVNAISVAMESSSKAIAATNLGAFKTSDGGKTWDQLSTRLPVIPFALEMYPRVKTRMVAAGDQGVYISTDEGATWIHSLPVTDRYDVRSFTFMSTDVSVVYAATANTASVISHDGGFHWEPSRFGIDTKSIDIITLDDQDPTVAYSWTPRGESFRSTNSGMEWNRYAPPWNPGDSVLLSVDRFFPSKAVALVRNALLYYSPNGGGTWFPLGSHEIHGQVCSLLWNETTGILYAAVRNRGLYMLPLHSTLTSLIGG